ncbi:MAG: copper homeostasis protein CutC [Bacteroidota bacterium]
MIRLEICVDAAESILAAKAGGADRLEVCGALPTGGTTPSEGLLAYAVENFGQNVMMMVRPRVGDFICSSADVKMQVAEIKRAKAYGIQGVVVGCLTEEGKVDQESLKELVEVADGMELTFHRAFEYVPDPYRATETLIEMGISRILTSGQASSAWEGRTILKELIATFGGDISIMPGAGVKPTNIREILAYTGAKEIHGSASQQVPSISTIDPGIVSIGHGKESWGRAITQEEIVNAMREEIDSLDKQK